MEQSITQLLKRKTIFTEEDEKELWEVYHSWGRAGTYSKLVKYAESRGMYDPDKGKPSYMGPFHAMWRYAFKHPEEAYPHWEKWILEFPDKLGEHNIKVNFETFLGHIEHEARRMGVKSEKKIDAWRQRWDAKLKEGVLQ